jgi:uncharacterized protein (DUF433 family)
MIAPPPGSFSWIPARYVERRSGAHGTVTENGVVVRVGSFQSDIRDVEQRRLNKGDQVQVLGEKMLQTDKGQEPWYQIAPPKGEYRWITGKFVTPLHPRGNSGGSPPGKNSFENSPDGPIAGSPKSRSKQPASGASNSADPYVAEEIISAGTQDDPFEVPVKAAQSKSSNGKHHSASRTSVEGQNVLRNGPTASELAADRQKVKALDTRLSQILEHEASQWNFEQLEQDYRQLQREIVEPALRYQIDLRLASINEYKQIKRDYEDFVKLTSQTTQREMQLLALQQNQQAQVTARKPLETMTAPPEMQPPPAQPAAPRPQRFDGAGIIQRSATTYPGAPRYVLLAPNGRVLAYLQAEPGVDLERAVGHAMGLNGQRAYDPNLRADFMRVRQLTPVRLAP